MLVKLTSAKYAWLQYLSKNPANTVIGLARIPAPVEERLMKEGITNVRILPGDMTSHASLAAAAELAAPLLPSGLDILIVNGAYINHEVAFLSPSDYSSASQAQLLHDDMHASLDTNVLGVVYSINAFLPLVLKGAVKKVVVISTGLADPDLTAPTDGHDGLACQVGYSALKGAVNIVIAKYAAELKSKGVIALALSPGVVNTRQTARKSH
jgi:NAD(P)-dependent dehydrogenase (short-subunit alcohol dehydrogenase family)